MPRNKGRRSRPHNEPHNKELLSRPHNGPRNKELLSRPHSEQRSKGKRKHGSNKPDAPNKQDVRNKRDAPKLHEEKPLAKRMRAGNSHGASRHANQRNGVKLRGEKPAGASNCNEPPRNVGHSKLDHDNGPWRPNGRANNAKHKDARSSIESASDKAWLANGPVSRASAEPRNASAPNGPAWMPSVASVKHRSRGRNAGRKSSGEQRNGGPRKRDVVSSKGWPADKPSAPEPDRHARPLDVNSLLACSGNELRNDSGTSNAQQRERRRFVPLRSVH